MYIICFKALEPTRLGSNNNNSGSGNEISTNSLYLLICWQPVLKKLEEMPRQRDAPVSKKGVSTIRDGDFLLC